MRDKPFRLLAAEGKSHSFKTAESRDKAAQPLADKTGEWVGIEDWEGGDWWLTRVVHPSAEPPCA